MISDHITGIRNGRTVEVVSLIYNIIEVVVSLTAGFATGSSALVSWGVDSIVEANSAAFMSGACVARNWAKVNASYASAKRSP